MAVEKYRVDGKVAIVTGAGRGMGKAIALALAEAGANVTVVARTKEQIDQTAVEIRKRGGKALSIPTDVTKEDQVKRAIERTVEEFGKIDILVNNAGMLTANPIVYFPGMEKMPGWEIAGDRWDKQLDQGTWQQVMDTNLTSALLFAQAVGPHMIKQKKGKIVFTGSTGADEGHTYFTSYCVSKAGLHALTRCLSSEWAQFNITVNALAPGLINTDMLAPFIETPESLQGCLSIIPLGRLGEPEDIALLTLFLASEASDYITGRVITIDGGAIARGTGV
jgi:2-deoxy-D-gluconate 3-dehydrogenase